MYRLTVLKNGLISHIELWGIDQEPICAGPVDTAKFRVKYATAVKQGAFEYLVWIKHYSAYVENALYDWGVATKDIKRMLDALEIKNEDLIRSVFAIRKIREQIQSSKQLSSKRKR